MWSRSRPKSKSESFGVGIVRSRIESSGVNVSWSRIRPALRSESFGVGVVRSGLELSGISQS